MLVPILGQVLEALKRIGKNTDAAGTNTLFALLFRGGVKNVQRGSAIINAGSTNVTVSAVVMAKSQLRITWKGVGTASRPDYDYVSATLTTTTNILLERVANVVGADLTISWELTEFY